MRVAHEALDAWLRRGRPLPPPDGLQAHLDGCDACRRLLADSDRARGAFPEREVLAAKTVDEIRFRLVSAANVARQTAPTRARLRGRIVYAAAAVLLAAGGAIVYAEHRDPIRSLPPSSLPLPSPRPTPEVTVAASVPTVKAVAPAPPPPRRRARPRPPSPPVASYMPPPAPDVDSAFHRAWLLVRAGHHASAAHAFDELRAVTEGPRRSDILYWSARSHLEAGHLELARLRLEELLRDHPAAWHRPHAQTLLDELR